LARLEPRGEVIKVSASGAAEGNRIDRLLVKEGDRVKTGQAIAILDSRDRQQAALDQAQEQVRVAEANLAKVKAGAKNGEIQAQKATIARIRADRSNEITAQRSLPEEKSIAAPKLQRNKPQLRASGPNSKVKFKPNKPQLPVYKPNSATPEAKISATPHCMNREQFPLQLATAKASPPKQPNSKSTKERQN